MSENERRAPRYTVDKLNIIYDTGAEYWIGPVVNMSSSGMFVETTHDLQPGTEIQMMPQGIEDERFPFELKGKVVRHNELDWDEHWDRTPGIAIMIVDLDDAQRKALDAFLDEHGEMVPEDKERFGDKAS